MLELPALEHFHFLRPWWVLSILPFIVFARVLRGRLQDRDMFDGIMATQVVDGKAGGNVVSRFNHVPGGCNVLYLDGHVEFSKYPGKFPTSEYMGVNREGGGVLENL